MNIGGISGYGGVGYYGFSPISRPGTQTNIDDPIAGASKRGECQTCKERKYVDGSDEMVSFKAPASISPQEAPGKVMAHEQEHVANAYTKAAEGGGKVLQASVSMKMAICPECGRSYVAGGETTTKIQYPKDNPYADNKKSSDYSGLVGSNIDTAV